MKSGTTVRKAAVQRTTVRRGLVAALAVVAAAVSPLPQLAHASDGSAPAETVVEPAAAAGPTGPTVLGAATSGYLTADGWDMYGNPTHLSWRAPDGSVASDLGNMTATFGVGVVQSGDGHAWVYHLTTSSDPRVKADFALEVYDTATKVWSGYPIPTTADEGRKLVPTATGWALVAAPDDTAGGAANTGPVPHLYTPNAAGGLDDRVVSGWPAGARWSGQQPASLPGTAEVSSDKAGNQQIVLIDTATASVTTTVPTALYQGANYPLLLLDADHFGYGAGRTAWVYDRTDPQAAPRTLTVPGAGTGEADMALTGGALLALDHYASLAGAGPTPAPLYAVPLDGSAARTLFDGAATLRASTGGSALVDAPNGSDAWATFRIPADGSAPAVLRPFTTYRPEHIGLSLGRGTLSRVETGAGSPVGAVEETVDVGTGAAPAGGSVLPRVWAYPAKDAMILRCGGQRCYTLVDAGSDLGAVHILSWNGKDAVETTRGAIVQLDTSGGSVLSASGNHAVYNSGSDGTQDVLDMWTERVLYTRPAAAAALWGDTLFTAGKVPGQVTQAPVATGKVSATIATDAPCVPDELQALGRWLYWSCGPDGPAGVWDGTTKKSVPVPAGHALLGDGYVLRHTGDQLLLTDIHAGTAAPDRLVATLPAGGYSDDRNITWTLDKFRGFLAWTGTDGATHVLPSGVPQSPVAVVASEGTASADLSRTSWAPSWTPSGPLASWSLDIRRQGSTAIVRSLSGGATPGDVRPVWDGKDHSGRGIANGPYTWTLKLVPANGQGPAAVVSGTVVVSGRPAFAHDYTGEGSGDLLAVTSGGRLDVRPGTGTAPGTVLATSASGTGWPSGSLFVPIGELSVDGYNDLLVRDATGHLTRYDGTPGRAFTPATPHHVIGAGWNIYNSLTPVGALNSVERADLLARDAGGNLYLYAASVNGVFQSRKQIGHGYGIYSMMIGAQDLNGDGRGDLLARDTSGVLWRYDRDSGGGLKARVRIGAGWNVYNSVVGVGDINGDGRNDLVARDGNGDLWRYDGLSSGLFAPRVKIGWAWQTYTSLL
ncbi:hypothetical protein SAMN05216267_102845 [Actinacidiphila rubida]|uniref:FlgD Ig-like domain-containing protein n=2 Tax=Actinacidiphila rubida TaxID=310780 RepID=A0A1H8Q5W4_9ACTN|nr:VCBS repeat-containing protein [Actinacidiphila rubida]SEO49304.1 hypothetical protein SAMN05216267_102845 [Actinacidiphila rubida]